MAAARQQLDLLEALAETPPRAYLQKQDSGQSTLRDLYAQAAEAGLVPASASDDIARLHALFDVALDHGMGRCITAWVTEVCSDRLLTSADPVEAFLLDAECVRRWAQKLLAVSRGRLAAWLGRGLGAAGGAGLLSKELGRLQMLQLVAQALQPRAEGGAGQPAGAAGAAAAAATGEGAEVAEAGRLVLCARVLAWLEAQQAAFARPSGRFFSEQEWRSVAAKRRDGSAAAGVGSLFLSDLASSLAAAGVEPPPYPPSSPDRLLSALFLGSGSSSAGGSAAAAKGGAGGAKAGSAGGGASKVPLHARLALLAYYLADGEFLQPAAIVQGLQSHFGVPPATAYSWLLLQLLDDSHTADASGNAALLRAAELALRVDGARLAHKALQVFSSRGRLDVALTLLRQRPESSASLEEAAVALGVRLQSGLLGEAFLGLRCHLDALAAAAASPAAAAEAQARSAEVLVGRLLQFAAMTSAVHAVVRMPFGAAEEKAVVEWLEAQAAGGRLEAALMLPLFYLLRGRTPEALHAYARLCPSTPTTMQQQELAALLSEAARMLPAPQRSLLVAHSAAPALRPVADGCEEAGAVSLMGSLADVAADVAPAMLSVGPTPIQAPLVGSIPVLLQQQRLAEAAAGGPSNAGGGSAAKVPGIFDPPVRPPHHRPDASPLGAAGGSGSPPQQAQPAAASSAGGSSAAGAGLAQREVPGIFDPPVRPPRHRPDASPLEAAGGGAGHAFDQVLGLAGPAGGRGGGTGKRRWGGSAYR